MKTQITQRTHFRLWAVFVPILLAANVTACASTGPYLSTNIKNKIKLQPSASHGFKYVNVEQDGKRLIVYGKVNHSHTYCESEAHVDIAIISPSGDVAFTASMPIIDRGWKRPGWYGAAFRARLPVVMKSGDMLRLAFHGTKCITTQTYDCGSNAARMSNVARAK